jgi:tetratricopeptide (TPR) repeat protein
LDVVSTVVNLRSVRARFLELALPVLDKDFETPKGLLARSLPQITTPTGLKFSARISSLLIFLVVGFGIQANVAWGSDQNFRAAEKLYKARQFAQAEHLYLLVDSESADFPIAQLHLGTIYYLTERPAQAERCFLTYLKFKQFPEAYCLLAGAQFNQKKYNVATESAQRALQLDARSAKAYTVLGMIRTAENDFGDAQTYYRKALKLNPDDSDTWFMLGRALFFRDDFAEAAKAFEQAIRINPQSVRSYDNLARTKDILSDREGAEKCYKEGLQAGLKQRPFDSHIYIGYGEFLLKLDRLADSQTVLEGGLRVAPASSELHYELSKVYFRMGRLQEAAHEGEAATRLGGPDYKVDFLLAQIYTAMGNSLEASKHAASAARESPSSNPLTESHPTN